MANRDDGRETQLSVKEFDASFDPVTLIDSDHSARLVILRDVVGLNPHGQFEFRTQDLAVDMTVVPNVSVVGDAPEIRVRIRVHEDVPTVDSPLCRLI
jgi:hypothetical protein